jgi:hypothetical protein
MHAPVITVLGGLLWYGGKAAGSQPAAEVCAPAGLAALMHAARWFWTAHCRWSAAAAAAAGLLCLHARQLLQHVFWLLQLDENGWFLQIAALWMAKSSSSLPA